MLYNLFTDEEATEMLLCPSMIRIACTESLIKDAVQEKIETNLNF